MIFGIVGLGLIGGSLAKSIKFHSSHTVLGCDIQQTALLQARAFGAVDGELTEENLGDCDVILAALYPRDAVAWLLSHQARFSPGRSQLLPGKQAAMSSRWACRKKWTKPSPGERVTMR